MKIGGSNNSGLGSWGGRNGPRGPFIPGDPFASCARGLRADDAAPGVSWFSSVREVAAGLALDWFGQYESVTLREYLESKREHDSIAAFTLGFFKDRNIGVDFDGIRVVPQVLDGPNQLGELVPIDDSRLGQRVRAYLDERGVTGMDLPVVAVGGVLADLGKTISWFGPWGTEFGSRAFVRYEIRKHSSGTEWCFVYTNQVVATRKPLGYAQAMAEKISIPRSQLQQLFIAETPFPSSIVTMSRSMAYPNIPQELWPIPLASVESPGLVTYIQGAGDAPGSLQHQFYSAPSVLRAGFAFSDEVGEHLPTIVDTLTSAATNLATIAEDGFRNYRNPDYPAPFDHVYGSEYVYFVDNPAAEGNRAAGYSRWVPEVLLGDLVNATDAAVTAAYQTSNEDERREILQWVVDEGAGLNIPSAINTLCYSYLIPEKAWDDALQLLDIAIDLDVLNESTNAMTNLGHLYMAKGEPELAKEHLLKALERLDKFSEAEACFLLGTIAREEGQSDTAREYFERGARAGGEFQEKFAQKCRDQLGENHPSPQPINFCPQCGVKAAPGARFCSSCGHGL